MEVFLTVIIPTYNRPHLAQRAINSVLAQNDFSGRLILINDGSDKEYDDEYLSIVEKLSERIDYVRHRDSMGVSAARNKGVSLAATDWILFLDDDDEVQGKYVAELFKHITEFPNVDLFWCNTQVQKCLDGRGVTSTESRFFSMSQTTEKVIHQALKIGASYGLAIRRSVFELLNGFDCDFKVCEDTEFLIRLISQGYIVRPIEYFGILKHEEHSDRLSHKYERYSNNDVYELLLERYAEFFSSRIDSRLNMMLWSLYVHLSNGNYSKAEKSLPLLLKLTDELSSSR